MRCTIALVLATGCGFTPGKTGTTIGDATMGDDDVPMIGEDVMPDMMVPILTNIAHVSSADEALLAPTADVTWSSSVLVNTMTLTVVPPLPSGATFTAITQEVGGTQVAILAVRNLTTTATVRVSGDIPLIIYATQTLDMNSGGIDIGGRIGADGAGARTSGVGLGQAGTHAGNYSDGGGGGGGFGTAGAAGGTATQAGNVGTGGMAGMQVGDAELTTLLGGSRGGDGQPATCGGGARALGGGGGGALQLSATTVALDGIIVAGGGGGAGGTLCTGNMGGPGGGGSGGAIYIQALTLTGAGTLGANGGGGGAGSNWNGGPGQDGQPGQSALTLSMATGGPTVAPDGGAGGAGSTGAAPAVVGESITSVYPNGGGGGGGAGRIYLDIPTTTTVNLTASPAALRP